MYLLAVQNEAEAGKAVYNIDNGVKITLHYDTTSRSKIDGDWPTISLRLSDGRHYSLRPLYLPHETTETIISLFLETLERLANGASGLLDKDVTGTVERIPPYIML